MRAIGEDGVLVELDALGDLLVERRVLGLCVLLETVGDGGVLFVAVRLALFGLERTKLWKLTDVG